MIASGVSEDLRPWGSEGSTRSHMSQRETEYQFTHLRVQRKPVRRSKQAAEYETCEILKSLGK